MELNIAVLLVQIMATFPSSTQFQACSKDLFPRYISLASLRFNLLSKNVVLTSTSGDEILNVITQIGTFIIMLGSRELSHRL